GTTTVTWTVTDGSGNIATCEQLVVVTDIELPTIVCPEDIVSCSNIIILTPPTVSDNCGIASITNDAPLVFPNGTTQVNWTVTDVNGNISECIQNVSISNIEVNITASAQVSCHNGSDGSITVNVEGTSGDVVYQLNGGIGQSSNVFEGLSAGTYVIVVIDDNLCNTTITGITIINPDPITLSVEISEQVSCYNESDGTITASAIGGTGDFQFSINGIDYQSTNIFEGLPSGSYTVYVKDENGCIAMSDTYIIANPEQLGANIDITAEISCQSLSDAEITINAWGGTPPYLYSLDGQTAQTSNVFTNLSVGIYSVRIEDAKGCFILQEVNVKQPDALELTYDAFCQGGIVGVRINGSGGNLPYQYSIDGGSTFQTSNQFDNTITGEIIYLVVKDANGCMSEVLSVEVENLNTLNAEVNIISQNLCHGSNDAAAEIIVTGGSFPYEFNMNNQGFTMNNLFQNLAPGSYSVQVRDLNTCPASVTFEIEEQSPILIQLVSQNDADCTGSGGGSAEISVQGGESPYTYNWSNGDHRATATNLPKGTHTVTVTDGNQCEILYNIEIGIDPSSQELDIPNVFSPNGDGINDTWVIKNLELHPENELVIINRWGNEVYTQKSYKNDWDGTQLNEGTYFYVLKVNMCNEERKLSGYLTIIK
ncbi:MAG: gliding motility-associated C-terminal domain-containing protein, partial [Bacteroidales bacterium]|nr:gliding motility-associated C-terminal domain-containing protein [Bacteroidales bacterium]